MISSPENDRETLSVWLTVDERSALELGLANCLDKIRSSEEKWDCPQFTKGEVLEALESVLDEIGVADSRYKNGRIPPQRYLAALGKDTGSTPLWVSTRERMILVTVMGSNPTVRNRLVQ